MSDDEFAALGALAEQSRVSKAWIGRQAISTLLEKSQENDDQMPLPLCAGAEGETINNRKPLTVIDLFCDAGGLSEGFRQAGFHVLAGQDFDEQSSATFAATHHEANFVGGPIQKVTPQQLLRVLAGRPETYAARTRSARLMTMSHDDRGKTARASRNYAVSLNPLDLKTALTALLAVPDPDATKPKPKREKAPPP